MVKFILWTIGLIIGLPIAFVTYIAFMIFVYHPAYHSWSVKRMDAKNDRVWEEATARVVTVEASLTTPEGTEELTTDIICYQGYFARPLTPTGGPQETGNRPKSIGFESLQAELPTGATLDIDLRSLCSKAFSMDINDLPLRFEYNEMNIVAPDLSLYCKFPPHRGTLHTDAGEVSYPYIVAVKQQPLRTLVTRSDMGSSATPYISSGFARRWGLNMRRSSWKGGKGCWGGRSGQCNEAMTNYCGENPR